MFTGLCPCKRAAGKSLREENHGDKLKRAKASAKGVNPRAYHQRASSHLTFTSVAQQPGTWMFLFTLRLSQEQEDILSTIVPDRRTLLLLFLINHLMPEPVQVDS